ncbi:MAG TPA: GNAT family N-acetyltransferase [Mycobacteriales bacterium]|nr:GNAT family N-acetyltransferase [Mycobacteriales bacterium]
MSLLVDQEVTTRSHDALLADGTVIEIRPVVASDEPALQALYARADAESMRRRFFSYSPHVAALDIARMVKPADRRQIALIALDRGEAVGVADLAPSGRPDSADLAVFVDDTHHGQGIGTLLIEHLIAAGRRAGYRHVHADVLSENVEMLGVLRELGVSATRRTSWGVVDVDFALPSRETWSSAVQAREGLSDHASLERLLAPSTVAVVGAGRRVEGVGHRIVANLVAGGFTGDVAAVNPGGDVVAGAPGYQRLADLPWIPDLVVVAVPARAVADVVRDAAAVGAHGVVVVSDGFAELGDEGRALQRDMVTAARHGGMRLIGPNCLGIINLDPAVRLNATFAAIPTSSGHVGVASQSGGVGLAVFEALGRRGIGVSSFVSLGNKADVSGNDLLQYWQHDPATSVCLLYLESFGNARKFAQIAREVGRTKPIVAITAGRSAAGARGVRSHTAAAATPEVAVEALFRQAGVISASSVSEALDIVALLDSASVPAGRRVAIISNGGGPAALAADACSTTGLELPVLSDRLQRKLARVLPSHAALTNPVDTTAGAEPVDLAVAGRLMAESGEVDSVIVIHASLEPGDRDALTAALRPIPPTRPVLAVCLGAQDVTSVSREGADPTKVACFPYPEDAARALAKVAAYGEWRHAPARAPRPNKPAPKKARQLVDRFLEQHPEGGWLDTDVAASLMTACRIPVAETVRVHTATEGVLAALRLHYPVVVKVGAGSVLHRTDENGVFVDLRSAHAVRKAIRTIHDKWGRDCAIVVQPMLPGGLETAVGLLQDRSVGPVVMLAMGGITTDLLADRTFCLPPVTAASARNQVEDLRAAPLFHGYRGKPPADVAALAMILRRVGDLGLQLPEVAELDLNPVVVTPTGATAVDVKVRLAPADTSDPYLRALSRR